jgi:hypothetical protein
LLLDRGGSIDLIVSVHCNGREPGFGFTPLARKFKWTGGVQYNLRGRHKADNVALGPARFIAAVWVNALVDCINSHHGSATTRQIPNRQRKRKGTTGNRPLGRQRRFQQVQMQGRLPVRQAAQRKPRQGGGTRADLTYAVNKRSHSRMHRKLGQDPMADAERDLLLGRGYRIYRYDEDLVYPGFDLLDELQGRRIFAPGPGEWLAVRLCEVPEHRWPKDPRLPLRRTVHLPAATAVEAITEEDKA